MDNWLSSPNNRDFHHKAISHLLDQVHSPRSDEGSTWANLPRKRAAFSSNLPEKMLLCKLLYYLHTSSAKTSVVHDEDAGQLYFVQHSVTRLHGQSTHDFARETAVRLAWGDPPRRICTSSRHLLSYSYHTSRTVPRVPSGILRTVD